MLEVVALVLAFVLLMIALFLFAMIIWYGFLGIVSLLYELQWYFTNRNIRMKASQLRDSGFDRKYEYIYYGSGISIDSKSKRIFLAKGSSMTIYDINDIVKVESEFETEQGVIRVSVKDLQNPLYEIWASSFKISKLREIESLLSLMREKPSS